MTIHEIKSMEDMPGTSRKPSTSMVDHCQISLTNFVPKLGFELLVILLFSGRFAQ